MLCVVQVGYGLGVKAVLVSGCFGAQFSVVLARGQQLKERVGWCEGSRVTFLVLFLTLEVYSPWRLSKGTR